MASERTMNIFESRIDSIPKISLCKSNCYCNHKAKVNAESMYASRPETISICELKSSSCSNQDKREVIILKPIT